MVNFVEKEIQEIQRLIDEGHFFEARRQAELALLREEDIRLKQLYALSLSKSGAPEAAEEFLQPVFRQNPDDPETAGILGGIYKELFKKTQEPKYALLSRDTYLKNFSITQSYYTGINAAAMAFMAGQASKGRETAREIISLIKPDTRDFWEIVTLAEANLLAKNTALATELYIKARKLVHTDWGKISSVKNQLWLLNHYLAVPTVVVEAFHPPGVAAFAGHMIDRPDRVTPRFPSGIESAIKDALISAIRTLNIKIGYTSIACGSDILFCEAITEAGGELNIILAFDKEEFVETSVRYAGQHWVDRFEKLLSCHPVTYVTHEKYGGTDELFSLQSRIILGAAINRGLLLQTQPYLLSVLSATDMARKEGGTRDTIKLWPFPKQQWVNVNPDNFVTDAISSQPQPYTFKLLERIASREVRYLVLVRLQQINDVIQSLHGYIAAIPDSPGIVLNEYDDTIIVAFKVFRDAGEFAFKAHDILRTKRLLDKTSIVLHAGPVVIKEDDTTAISGDQVEILRYIGNIVLPGSLTATNTYALTASLPPDLYTFEYTGRVELNMFSITLDLYRVSR